MIPNNQLRSYLHTAKTIQRARPPYPQTMIAALLLITGVAAAQGLPPSHTLGPPLPTMPDAFSPMVLRAVNDPDTGLAAFSFNGSEVPPVLHGRPGSTLRVTYINAMSTHSKEICVDGPCTNMTNLHFHGLHVSPNAPQDDVISMMAMPGQSLQYQVEIPAGQPPGLYWYHTHPHGESYQQSLDGMSGAILIDGIERYVPEVRSMRQQIIVLRDAVLKQHDSSSAAELARVEAAMTRCGGEKEQPERLFTTNGVLRPSIAIAPGERQFWRIVNASPDLYADLTVDGEQLKVIALDGMPLAYHDPARRARWMTHVLLAPAGRVEAIVTGPARNAHAALRSECVDTGTDGDPNPAMVLADLTGSRGSRQRGATLVAASGRAVYRPIATTTLAKLKREQADFVVRFTEDKQGFYINDKKYAPEGKPMVSVPIGAYHHWSVVNQTHELHPFHIHQVHFMVYKSNGVPLYPEEWLDTVNVPPGGALDLVMDFTDPVIRGMSVFHCHLLKHEDKGMMAKILFQ